MLEKTFVITDAAGIHARPANALVRVASQFKSDIKIAYNGKDVNLKSILGVMSLGIGQNAEIKLITDGEDKAEALEALESTLVDEGLVG